MNNESAMRQESANRTKVLDLDHKVAAVLCYTPILLLSVIAPIVFLKTEPNTNKRLRFHAVQGLGLSIAAILLAVANSMMASLMFGLFGFGALQLVGSLSSLISLAFLAAAGYGIYCVCKDKEYRLPFLAEIADRNA